MGEYCTLSNKQYKRLIKIKIHILTQNQYCLRQQSIKHTNKSIRYQNQEKKLTVNFFLFLLGDNIICLYLKH